MSDEEGVRESDGGWGVAKQGSYSNEVGLLVH